MDWTERSRTLFVLKVREKKVFCIVGSLISFFDLLHFGLAVPLTNTYSSAC